MSDIKLENDDQIPNLEQDEESSAHSESSEEKNEGPLEIQVEIKENELKYKMDEEKEENYEENEEEENTEINIEASVRNGFIRKVYGILSIQLIITFSFVLLFQLPSIKKLILSNIHLSGNILLISSILFFFLFLTLACCRTLSKTVPYNYIVLLGITLCEALSCSIVSACYSFEVVAISLFLTIVTTLTITFYACITKTDFSYLRLVLLIIFSQLFMVGLISVILRLKFFYAFYTFLSTIIIGIYLVYDTQLIIGKLGYAYSIDEYIFASLEIYIDIIRLFLLILRIVAEASSRRH